MNARIRKKANAVLDRRIAYHEAGHALMGRLCGLEIVTVSMMNRHTVFNFAEGEATIEHVKVGLAGYLGELVGLGNADPRGPSKDLKDANALLKVLKNRTPTGTGLQDEVREALETNRPSLIRIAEALLAERTLSPERVSELMRAD